MLAQIAERLGTRSARSTSAAASVAASAVIVPESGSEDASQLFDRMHDAVATMSVPGGHKVRVSAGIAELRHGETAAGLFERADSALYRAKDQGKDQATLAAD